MRQGRLPGCDAGIEVQPVAGYTHAESAMGRCDGPLRVHAWRKRQSGYPAWRSCISRKRETARASHPAGRHGGRGRRKGGHIKRGLLPGISEKEHLRRRGKRKVKRRANYNTIHPERIIPEWPEEIRPRKRIGDWEGDTLCGGGRKGGAITLLECKSGWIYGRVVHSRQASETREAILEALKDKPVHSLSLDNGSEFAEFRELEEQLKAPVYFAEPHKPWQRGCNENANGPLRFFFPKGCNFLDVSQASLTESLI